MKNRIGSYKLDHAALRSWMPAAVVVGIAWALCAADPASATDGLNRASTVVCSSDNGQRRYCKADTRHGVRLIRQVHGSGCAAANWGYDAGGVWVDRGCQAEFDLSGEAGNARDGAASQTRTIGAGTNISVRNNEAIDVQQSEDQAFSGAVYQDVLDEKGDVAIPKGSYATLIVTSKPDGYLALDLKSVEINGRRYPVTTVVNPTEAEQKNGPETAARTGDAGGGGSAPATAQVLTPGSAVQIPAASSLTFRLERSLEIAGGGQ